MMKCFKIVISLNYYKESNKQIEAFVILVFSLHCIFIRFVQLSPFEEPTWTSEAFVCSKFTIDNNNLMFATMEKILQLFWSLSNCGLQKQILSSVYWVEEPI